MKEIRAITLWQPWASLLFVPNGKTFETRAWETKYRGSLVICAAKTKPSLRMLAYYLCINPFTDALEPHITKAEHFPMGKALGIVDLVDCIKTDNLTLSQIECERSFGDFSLGRYAWATKNPRKFTEPFEVKGRQRFFNVDVSGKETVLVNQ